MTKHNLILSIMYEFLTSSLSIDCKDEGYVEETDEETDGETVEFFFYID
jgi:hypothetical protein